MWIPRRVRVRPALWVRLLLLAAIACVLVIAITRSTARQATSGIASAARRGTEVLPADYPRSADPCPDFRLVDQRGEAFGPERLQGTPTVMVFVFSHCQAICPGLVRDVRTAAQRAGSDSTRLVMITIDPARDTPAVLPQIAGDWQLGPSEWLLSGPPEDVERLLDAFGVARERDERTGEVAHPPLVVVLDPGGRQAYRLNAPPITWIVEAVNRSRAG